jgi:hypothetical protein
MEFFASLSKAPSFQDTARRSASADGAPVSDPAREDVFSSWALNVSAIPTPFPCSLIIKNQKIAPKSLP